MSANMTTTRRIKSSSMLIVSSIVITSFSLYGTFVAAFVVVPPSRIELLHRHQGDRASVSFLTSQSKANILDRRRCRSTRSYSSSISSSSDNDDSLLSSIKESSKKCSVELIDPETGCEVVLLGCFHGSQSSAYDVEYALTSKPTNVVVLELCADRFDDLRKEVLFNSEQQNVQTKLQSSTTGRVARPWMVRYLQMVYDTYQEKGISTSAAVAVLGGVSGMQTALSGLQPGLEFTTALRIATTSLSTSNDASKQQQQQPMDIVLADQNVDVTIYKMGQLPKISLQLWKDYLSSFGTAWDTSFGQEAAALHNALFGSYTKDNKHVQLFSFLTRNDAAVRDLVRLTIPPLAVVQLISISISHLVSSTVSTIISIIGSAVDVTSLTSAASTSATTTSDPLLLVLANGLFLGFVYLSVALPAAQVILRERDDQLTDGIRTACRLATKNGKTPGRVVAVLGLLHVNGIAKRMTSTSTTTS